MADLIKCSQCDGQISVHAVMICPHCGCPAEMALTQTYAAKAKPKEEPAQELEVTKYFEVEVKKIEVAKEKVSFKLPNNL